MFTSADLIDVLRRRRRRSIRPEAVETGFPPAWETWLAAQRARVGAVTGAAAGAIVAILASRPAPPRPRFAPPRSRLHAWATLIHPMWQPPPRDQRGLRRVSLVGTLLVQIVWLSMLFTLMNARFLVSDAPAALGEEHVVQAVFIGTGTPETRGGGAPDTPSRVESPAAPAARAVAPVARTEPVESEALPEPAAAERVEEPVAPQVLQVTVTPRPDIDFVLPPPQPRATVPDIAVREREVAGAPLQAVDVPTLRSPASTPVPAPRPREVEVELRERAISAPLESIQAPEITRREVALDAPARPAPTTPDIAARERPVPLREPAGRPVPAAPPTPAPGSGGATGGQAAPMAGSGRGPAIAAPPGAPPGTRAADDWGDGARARDGGQAGRPSGLLGADGRPRLADGGRVGGGLPPGTVTEDFARIDREGLWLRRPPTGYEPTRFDRLWVPSETLLEEWVRRSIKTVLIPIPGTSKTIQCNVALLAFGGGCGITDPNMQDVESDGRPPPDVPWKPELQEDQDSLGG